MSADNVETVRTAYEAFMRGDLDGVAESFADEVE
jgi:ketosteroid isomerase-like protein